MSACAASLRRLNTDRLDLYLLHWRGTTPLSETLEAFRALQQQGKIRYWGVSNFDLDDMEELESLALAANGVVATNQVLYNLMRRGIEYDLLPWCRTRGVPLMAYSPLEQGRLVEHRTLIAIAKRLDASPAQVAVAWVLRQDGVMTIPKSGDAKRVRENHGALALELSAEDISALDDAFPPPARKVPLAMI